MNIEFINLDENQIDDIENRLSSYDEKYITYKMSGNISIGIQLEGKLIGGVDACMTAFKILYVSSVFVDEEYRGQGIGKLLMKELEKRARDLGSNLIRLDTFNWQGKEFYESLGYEQVGSYCSEIDGFSEYFYLKKL